MTDAYMGLRAALATMHGKQSVIAPVMHARLGLSVVTPPGLDTDVFGSFAGDIARTGSMREVAIRKARMGMAAAGMPIGIASEGSFGPHPAIPFMRAGLELMVFIDDKRGLIVSESLIDADTNHDETLAAAMDGLDAFLSRARFPSHALVVAPATAPASGPLIKGIGSTGALAEALRVCAGASGDGLARITTDMRAHMNPTRMQSIARLADRLAHRIASPCPRCASPGFGRIGPGPGAPCSACGTQTIQPRSDLMRCPACGLEEEAFLTPVRMTADPGSCPLCNP